MATPRILAKDIDSYLGRVVMVVGQVKTSANGRITLNLGDGELEIVNSQPIPVGQFAEVVCSLNPQQRVGQFQAAFPLATDFDLALYQESVTMAQSYPDIFGY
eukprot:TRINITY_DN12619_c0_g1_i1.p1 TRINITY_DN12619_c0_g1~~TRINITY_DN12619_c0_g1_i1.p1  ORF type:complete len:103 (-),score=18.18 TRINITY_DN12619_c0_g1_i1:29-337(-)